MNDYDEFEIQEEDQMLEKAERAIIRRQQKQAIEAQSQMTNESFMEALKELDMNPEDFSALVQKDVKGAEGAFRKGIKEYVKEVAGKKAPETLQKGDAAGQLTNAVLQRESGNRSPDQALSDMIGALLIEKNLM